MEIKVGNNSYDTKGFLSSMLKTDVPLSENPDVAEILEDGVTSVVYSCVDLISKTVALNGFKLYKNDKVIFNTKDKSKYRKTKNLIIELFKNPNKYMTWYDFIYLKTAMMVLFNESYIYVIRDKAGIPRELHIIPNHAIRPVFKEDNSFVITHFEVIDGNGDVIKFSTNEIIYDFLPSLKNPFRGESRLSKITTEFNIHVLSKKFAEKYYENGAVPLGILSTDKQLTPKQIEEIRNRWNSIHQGLKDSWGVAILYNGMKYEKLSTSPDTSEFVEQSKWTRDDILSIFRVPPFKLGYTDGISGTSAKEQNETFARDCILPEITKLEEFFNYKLIPSLTKENIIIEFFNPIPKDAELEVQKAKISGTFGVATINEIRQFIGLDKLEGKYKDLGDMLIEPLNLPEGRKPADERKPDEEGSKSNDVVEVLKQIDNYINSIGEE